MTGIELIGCALALAGCVAVLSMLERYDGLFRAWMVFLVALGLALLAMVAALLELDLRLVAALRILSNVLWAGSAVRFALQLRQVGLVGPLRGGWRSLTGVVAAITAGLLALYFWLGFDGSETWVWRLRQLVGIVADAVVLNACVQVLRFTWPMRQGRVARPYAFFILAALTFIVRGVLAQLGAPAVIDTLAAAISWGAVVAAPWQQARLTRSLMQD